MRTAPINDILGDCLRSTVESGALMTIKTANAMILVTTGVYSSMLLARVALKTME